MKHAHRESFMAGIVVQYGRDAPERYEAHLSITPLGETCVLLRRPFADRLSEGNMVRVIALYGCVVIAVSLLATLGPVRRALRIQPLEALRAE